MAQKDKVKELVGRSLDSYHTKALQQIDRIERKNKEQNHKINILTNELDNNYLTKTEEGSIVSLEHSKEGVVYLDELQGNTLVNYCTDGGKELILNGDIDVKGTNVALNDTVDNGLVDVACEGNTLVNLVKNTSGSVLTLNYPLTIGKQYTFVVEFESNMDCHFIIEENTSWCAILDEQKVKQGFNKFIVLSRVVSSDYTGLYRLNLANRLNGSWSPSPSFTNVKCSIIEGDYTNSVDEVFEGMKSVGECEDNKIEILSRNKNLWDTEKVKTQGNALPPYTKNNNIITYTKIGNYGIYVPIKVKKNETLRISGTINNVENIRIFKESDKFQGGGLYSASYGGKETTLTKYVYTFSEDGVYHIRIWLHSNGQATLTNFLVEINDTNTTYVEHKHNKKEISLPEPLRALPSGVKDKIVKIGGKWYVERNCGEVTLDGSQDERWVLLDLDAVLEDYPVFYFAPNPNPKADTLVYCNNIPPHTRAISANIGKFAIGTHSSASDIRVCIESSKLSSRSVTGFKQWLQANPTNVVYQLKAPYYEPLEVDPTLNTYNDITHISNNSTIPCNMKITNTGYNAIIKPSTQYTVAFDTDKSGEVGINLGGSKVTTDNNVAAVTTPSTLADDSLRLTGKGVKANKVRLLEGDKTNWIPSYFEGMKSCFEDKLQDDGTYKMEILSEDKNKLNGYNFARSIFNSVKNSVLDTENKTIKYNASDIDNVILKSIKFKENTRYTIILKGFNSNETMQSTNIKVIYTDGSTQICTNFINGISEIVTKAGKTVSHLSGNWGTLVTTLYYDECGIFEGVDVPFEPYKYHNKIQFSSIEPLRGVGNVKDRFVFKDGKLMIERNCGAREYQEGDLELGSAFTDKINTIYVLSEPYYEEVSYEAQKITLECYENGTLFFDTNIPPTVTVTYTGETPIVKSVRLNKTEVLNNTTDINDNIVPYLMDMDYRVVCLQLEGGIENISMARLFGGTFEMLQRDILSNRYSVDEYRHRLDIYLSANKITQDEYTRLGDMLND